METVQHSRYPQQCGSWWRHNIDFLPGMITAHCGLVRTLSSVAGIKMLLLLVVTRGSAWWIDSRRGEGGGPPVTGRQGSSMLVAANLSHPRIAGDMHMLSSRSSQKELDLCHRYTVVWKSVCPPSWFLICVACLTHLNVSDHQTNLNIRQIR